MALNPFDYESNYSNNSSPLAVLSQLRQFVGVVQKEGMIYFVQYGIN